MIIGDDLHMSVSANGYQITRHEASLIVFLFKIFMQSLLVNRRRARVTARRNGLYRCLLHAIGKRICFIAQAPRC